MDKCDILLTYDDPQLLDIIGWSLKDRGYSVTTTASVTEATEQLDKRHFDVVLAQLITNPKDGFSVLKHAKEIDPETIVILLGGKEVAQFNCEELPQEADEYVFTPCGIPKLWKRVQNCLETLALRRRDAHCVASRKHLVALANDLKMTIGGAHGPLAAGVEKALSQQLETVYGLIGQANAMLDASPARIFNEQKTHATLGRDTTPQQHRNPGDNQRLGDHR